MIICKCSNCKKEGWIGSDEINNNKKSILERLFIVSPTQQICEKCLNKIKR